MVTRAFPPVGGGGVQRMVKFATYLRNHNWNATVVAPDKDRDAGWHDESQLELPGAKDVIRVGKVDLRRVLYKRIVGRILPIDAYYSWARQVTKTLLNEVTPEFRLIFTSGPPHSVHWIGKEIAAKRNLAWVADFRDHYTLGPEYKPTSSLHRAYDRRFEEAIFKTADMIICNTRTNRRELIAKFGTRYAKKLKVIYNGFDQNDLTVNNSNELWTRDRRSYLYLGGLRGGHIDDHFFRIVDRLQKTDPERAANIAVRIVGDSSRKGPLVDALVASGMVTIHPPVPADSLGSVLQASDGCVAWQRSNPQYRGTIGGKIFDYLAAEKPIFSLGQPSGEVDRLLRRFKIGVNVEPGNLADTTDAFIQFDEQVQNNAYPIDESKRECLNRFSRQYQAKQLADVFDEVIATGANKN
jgi:glycosyltransferase involved in cell wall biosynthesis